MRYTIKRWCGFRKGARDYRGNRGHRDASNANVRYILQRIGLSLMLNGPSVLLPWRGRIGPQFKTAFLEPFFRRTSEK